MFARCSTWNGDNPPDPPASPRDSFEYCPRCKSWEEVRFQARRFVALRCGHGHDAERLRAVSDRQERIDREDAAAQRAGLI